MLLSREVKYAVSKSSPNAMAWKVVALASYGRSQNMLGKIVWRCRAVVELYIPPVKLAKDCWEECHELAAGLQ